MKKYTYKIEYIKKKECSSLHKSTVQVSSKQQGKIETEYIVKKKIIAEEKGMMKINDRTAKYSDVDSTFLPQTPAMHVPPALPSSPELHGRVLRGRGARAESGRRLR